MVTPPDTTTARKAQWLSDWYREDLKDRARPRFERWSGILDVPLPRWGVRVMQTKWGSCNPEQGLVWLNLDLAKKPPQALEYVILHEMAHFLSAKHDELFLSILDRNMPGWRQIRADLNALPLSA